MNTSQKNFMVPLAFVGMMFFAIGFALGINSFLMPVLERSMEMSASESNLLLAATFVPFLIFGIPATKCIEAIGYKKTMALSFIIFAIAFGLFIQAAATESIVWFLFASFICGAANAVLQASVNPYCNYSWTYRVCRKTYFHHGYLQQTGLACYYSFYYLSNRQNHRPN